MNNSSILSPQKIRLNASFASKEEAINAAGELLLQAGHIDQSYIPFMQEREKIATTYVGNGLAVPHGTREALSKVRSAGISVIQVPSGIDFGNGNVAKLIIGLAANGDNHLDILTSIAEVCSDDVQMQKLIDAKSAEEIITILESGMQL